MSQPTTEQLVVSDLHKRYGDNEVLKGVSLSAHAGDVISIIGSSGSGKSTFLRCINLLERPHIGSITLNGETLNLAAANDGMLHAINGGCYDPQGQRFVTKGGGCKVEHPLGSELWAYGPFNFLPHLRWLVDPDYAHVPYLDGKPRIFDARIFTADSTHPNGWGTVLVAGFRFGGGELELPNNRNKNRYADFGSVDQIVTRSGYVVIDITDPEVPPTVLAEITHPEVGFANRFTFFLVIRQTPRPPRGRSSAASNVYKRQTKVVQELTWNQMPLSRRSRLWHLSPREKSNRCHPR